MSTNRRTKIEIVIEKNDGMLWGIVEDKGKFTPTPYGETTDKLIRNLKDLVTDYQKNGGGKKDPFWGKVDFDSVSLEIKYNVQAFFEEFDALKINSIAKEAGVNESLLRQYATGAKYPSADQVKKIETAIHKLAKRLEKVSMCA